jgi:hypothetical protein
LAGKVPPSKPARDRIISHFDDFQFLSFLAGLSCKTEALAGDSM